MQDFSGSEQEYKNQKGRFLKSIFNLVNGENVQRDGYSIPHLRGAMYCDVCRLFGGNYKNAPSKYQSTDGFNDLMHADDRTVEHEGSVSHCKCMLVWIARNERRVKFTMNWTDSSKQRASTCQRFLKKKLPLLNLYLSKDLLLEETSKNLHHPRMETNWGALS